MMRPSLIAVCASTMLSAVVAAPAAAQQPAGAQVIVPGAEQFDLTASGSGRRYRIFVARPFDPAPPEGYPVIYLLDGNATFQTAAETVRLQTRKPKGYGPAVLVAIGYETDQPFDVEARYFDYTTPAAIADLPPRRNGEPWPKLGGADVFLDFIERDLKPEIGRKLPVDVSRQTLSGHSLGGFFTLHTFLHRPETFSTYVAGSPSIWWNRSELLGVAHAFIERDVDVAGKRLMIGIGAAELEDMVAGSRAMAALLSPLVARGLTFRHVEFEGEEHITVLPALISRLVGFSLAPDQPTGSKP
jgi:predicted alpha/beta superfamily hydrolase